MNEVPFWDGDLTKLQVKGLRSQDKNARVSASFGRKVALLERYGRDGAPPGFELPTSRPRLRDWYDPAERLWRWYGSAPDHPEGKNSHLHARYVSALGAIQARSRSSTRDLRPVPSGRRTDPTTGNDELLKQNLRLLEEVVQLRAELAKRPEVKVR